MIEQMSLLGEVENDIDCREEMERIVDKARKKYGYYTAHVSGCYELEKDASPREMYHILSLVKTKNGTMASVYIDNKKFKCSRSDLDDISAFIDDECKINDEKTVECEKLYKKYTSWCDELNKTLMPFEEFDAGMKNRFKAINIDGKPFYTGISLSNKSSNLFFKSNFKKCTAFTKENIYSALGKDLNAEPSKEFKNSVKIVFESNDDLLDYFNSVLEYQIEHYFPANRFGCCSKYSECAKEGHCVHSHPFYAKGCYYREIIEKKTPLL